MYLVHDCGGEIREMGVCLCLLIHTWEGRKEAKEESKARMQRRRERKLGKEGRTSLHPIPPLPYAVRQAQNDIITKFHSW